MSNFAAGKQVRLILNSDDLTTAAPLVIYDMVTQDVITLGANQRLIIYVVSIANGDTAALIEAFDDKDASGSSNAGETLFKLSMNAKSQAGYAYTRGFALTRVPKVKASAASANTSVIMLGDIQGV